jgi:hypothetical protein
MKKRWVAFIALLSLGVLAGLQVPHYVAAKKRSACSDKGGAWSESACVERRLETPPDPAGWKRFDMWGHFSFAAPADTVETSRQGIDSVVGQYRSDGFTVVVDYGAGVNSVSDGTPWHRIDGWPSRYTSGRSADICPTGIYANLGAPLPTLPGVTLNMSACARDEAALSRVQQVFRSVRFGSPRDQADETKHPGSRR